MVSRPFADSCFTLFCVNLCFALDGIKGGWFDAGHSYSEDVPFATSVATFLKREGAQNVLDWSKRPLKCYP